MIDCCCCFWLFLLPALQLPALRLLDCLLDRLDALAVQSAARRNDPLVRGERATLAKVERRAVHVGAFAAGFLDEKRTGGVVLQSRRREKQAR